MTTKTTLYTAQMSVPQFIADVEKVGNIEVGVEQAKGFPTQVRLEITYNNAPRTWLDPDEARELAGMLLQAADIAAGNVTTQSLGIAGCLCRVDGNGQLILDTMVACPMHGFGPQDSD